MRKLISGAVVAGAALAFAAPASASVVVLDFEGTGNTTSVGEFYNGGTDGAGNTGTNYGVSFSRTSLSIIDSDAGGTGNFANEPSPNTVLFFLSGGAATMNVAAGFTTGFSFYYAGNATNAGFVTVYDGLNATGSILATLSLSPNGGNCSGDPNGFPFCQFDPFGVAFSGTARSVDFGGVANQIAFDNITLGSSDPTGAVPEPSTWLMLLLGFFAIGGVLRRQKPSVDALSVSYS